MDVLCARYARIYVDIDLNLPIIGQLWIQDGFRVDSSMLNMKISICCARIVGDMAMCAHI